MLKFKPLLIAVFVLLNFNCFCQCPFNTKFGKITAQDFSYHSSFTDSNSSADAIVLFDIGNSELESNNAGGMRSVFNKHIRIKILTKKGYNAATVKNILLKYNKENEEDLINLKASTFNLESNEVKEYKFERKSEINANVVNHYFEDIFTLPSIKEGSIIEYSYTIKSDFFTNIHPWYFQGIYPEIYSEYDVVIPEFLKFNFDIKPYVDLAVTKNIVNYNIYFDVKATRNYYGKSSQEVNKWVGDATETKWISNSVPPVNNEPFLNNRSNYFTRVKFNFTELNIASIGEQKFSVSWNVIERKLKKDPSFGLELYADNNWLKAKTLELIDTEKNTDKIVHILFEYIRDHFNCTGNFGIYLKYQNDFHNIFTKKEGTEAELNLLLISMLKQINIDAYPVLVSTKQHGYVNQAFPNLEEYNYLLCKVVTSDNEYFLDDSKQNLGFNRLLLECYNDNGRIIGDKNSYDVNFSADSVNESKRSFVYISNDENGISSANCKETYGYYESLDFRDEFINKPIDKIQESIEKDFTEKVKLKDFSIDSLKMYDYPIGLNYYIDYHFTDDIVYFNPLMNQAITENPFKSATRKFPVEKPYTEQLNYSFTMEVPKGYAIDEIPKSANVLLNEDEGLFEYKISVAENLIQLRCKLKFNKATYSADDYQTLRDFYGVVVKKMSEQIVFKKIK